MVDESTSCGRKATRKQCFGSAATKRLRNLPALGVLSLAIAIAHVIPVHAQNAGEARDYAMSSQPLGAALNQLALTADRQIMVPPELVRGRTAPALAGHYSLDAALNRLLAGSGLVYEITSKGTVLVKRAPPPPSGPAKPATVKADQEPEPATLQSVTVTGTRIRGGTTPSPVITIGAEDIQQEGFADLGEVIRSVPQNFRGGQNPGAVAGAASLGVTANQNINGGSALNLRGLGPDATLTLLNGKRMSYGSFVQAVDISAIPVTAVERLEIMPDGASAIYGSDAVAGVGNVILKRDFDGVAVGARYGGATQGGMSTRSYDITAGTTWSRGGVIATYLDSSADPLRSDQRAYTEYMYRPFTVYPELRQRSGLLSAYQAVGDSVELRVDALRTERTQFMQASFGAVHSDTTTDTTTSFVSPGIEFDLGRGWSVSFDGTWGRDKIDYSVASVMASSDTVIQALDMCHCNESRMYELGAEGPLFTLGGGDARLAVGTGYRKNSLQERYYFLSSMIGGDEDSRFGYAEISLPFIGSTGNVRGVHRFEVTAALRSEDYDSFGKVTTPKLGLIYDPSPDLTLRASWGRSFKAPTLFQRYSNRLVYLGPAAASGGTRFGPDATVLAVIGGNLDLGPERAKTWSASLAFHPSALPGLDAELTFFNIDYVGRVVMPIPNSSQALSNPVYDEFVVYAPSRELQAEIIATRQFYNNTGTVVGPGDYDPDDVVAVYFNDNVNAARQKIRGVDLSGTYRLDAAGGHLEIRGSASWLDSSQRTTSLQQDYDLAGTIYNPARINGRVGAVWNRRGLTASLFANYIGGVTNTWTAAGASEKIPSMTTFDAVLRYAVGGESNGVPSWDFALSAQNLFDRDPPFYTIDSVYQLPYDATNYSPIGRFLSVSVSRHW
jgi:outer membrane receptor protein involved in Fe transport